MSDPRKRFKIYHDEAKARLTNHWDWDYMTEEEIQASLLESQHADDVDSNITRTSVWDLIIHFFSRKKL